MNIVITGFMATGKTEISKALCTLLGYSRIDTDDEIVKEAGMSINDIFAKFGEEHFRKLEKDIAKRAAKSDKTVISTGGGLVLEKDNVNILREGGVVVNLDADFSVIEARVQRAAATRPLLQNNSMEQIKERFEYRKPFYANCDCKIEISNKKSPKDHAQMIVEELKKNNFI